MRGSEVLTLYHGSNIAFERPELRFSKTRRDFGTGFYTAMFKAQAEAWARNMMSRFGGDSYLYTFAFDVSSDLKVLEFPAITVEWLEMVRTNRVLGGLQHHYDVVIGPVANDDTMRTIALYIDGVYAASEAMRRLGYSKPNNQVSLHTDAAMGLLTMIGRDRV